LAPRGASLFVGGAFRTAGDKVSSGIARWDLVPVPVVVSDFLADSRGREIVLRWRLPENALSEVTGGRGHRAENAVGPFAERTIRPLAPTSSMSFRDSVETEQPYWYRLELGLQARESVIVGPIQVVVAARGARTTLYPPIETRDGVVQIRYVVGST